MCEWAFVRSFYATSSLKRFSFHLCASFCCFCRIRKLRNEKQFFRIAVAKRQEMTAKTFSTSSTVLPCPDCRFRSTEKSFCPNPRLACLRLRFIQVFYNFFRKICVFVRHRSRLYRRAVQRRTHEEWKKPSWMDQCKGLLVCHIVKLWKPIWQSTDLLLCIHWSSPPSFISLQRIHFSCSGVLCK